MSETQEKLSKKDIPTPPPPSTSKAKPLYLEKYFDTTY